MKKLSTSEWIAVVLAIIIVVLFIGAQMFLNTSPLPSESLDVVDEEMLVETATGTDEEGATVVATGTATLTPELQ